MNTVPAFIFLFIAIIGGFYGFNYLMEIDKEKGELVSVNETRSNIAQAVAAKEELVASGNAILRQVEVLKKEKEELSKQVAEVTASLRDLESTHSYLTTSVPKMVEEVRTSALGKSLGDVKLSNGPTLRDAKPTQITDNNISFLHFAGSSRVGKADLPNELKDRFRIGKPPIREASASILGATSSTPATTSSAAKAQESEADATASISAMKEKIAVLGVQIKQAESNVESWLEQATKHDELANEARTSGRPTYTHTTEASKARAAAETLRDQIGKAQILKAQLEARLQQTEKEARS